MMSIESIQNTSMRKNKYILCLIFFVFVISAANLQVNSQEYSKTQSRLQQGKINCFVYHRFGDNRYPSTNISVEDFRKHLDYLKTNEYNVVTFGEAVDMLNSDISIPQKTVCLTVDDGYKSFYENALPLLKEFGYPATLFINTNQFGSGDFLSVEELKKIKDAGIEIGNHSHSHVHFVNFSSAERRDTFRKDLEKSQKIFQEKLDFAPEVYAYPYGEYTLDMQKVLLENGFKGAAAQKSGVISEYSDQFALPRFPMAAGFVQLESFIRKVKMKPLPAKPPGQANPLVENENPPTLQLKLFESDKINTNQIQCFIDGQNNCQLQYDSASKKIAVKSNQSLHSRRTLYTITAPSNTNPVTWYWYSFLWIIPSVNE